MSQRILVIDDEPKIRQLLQELLALHHYEAVTAASGLEALELLKSHPVQLILLDLMMPGMDGWQRSCANSRRTPRRDRSPSSC